VLLTLAAKKGCPTAGAWEFLNTRGWTTPQSVTVSLRETLKHQEIAAEAAKLAADGASTETISRVLGTTWQTARNAVKFAESGGTVPTPEFRPKGTIPPETDDATAAEVVRLREQESWSFT